MLLYNEHIFSNGKSIKSQTEIYLFLELDSELTENEIHKNRKRELLFKNWESKVFNKINRNVKKSFKHNYENYSETKNDLYREYLEVNLRNPHAKPMLYYSKYSDIE